MDIIRNLIGGLFNLRRGFLADMRLWALLVPAVLILAVDMPVLFALVYAVSAILLVVAIAHFVRRVIFPYLDLEEVAASAADSPTGSGLVFFSASLVVASVVIATAIWIAK